MKKYLIPDGDQTGLRCWVCDGSDAIIAGAWGQDPNVASGTSIAEMDLGTGIINGSPFAATKCADLLSDYNQNGKIDRCEDIIYTITIRNTGSLAINCWILVDHRYPANRCKLHFQLSITAEWINGDSTCGRS